MKIQGVEVTVDVDLDDEAIAYQMKTRRILSRRGAITQYTGPYKLLVVRVTYSAIYDSVRLSAEEIGDNVFGIDGDNSGNATLLERMDLSSKGLFNFERMTGSALINLCWMYLLQRALEIIATGVRTKVKH